MGLRGPKRMTDAEARRVGYKRRPIRTKKDRKAIKSKPGAPFQPKGIQENLEAKKLWDALEKKLVKAQVLTPEDGPVFEGLVKAYLQATEADRIVAANGMVIETHFGLKANPAVTMSRKAWGDVRKFAAEFGLSPTSRARIGAGGNLPDEATIDKEREAQESAEQMLFGRAARVVGAIGRGK